ncbi:hypothetical protein D3C87_747380 [compost metagenome]
MVRVAVLDVAGDRRGLEDLVEAQGDPGDGAVHVEEVLGGIQWDEGDMGVVLVEPGLVDAGDHHVLAAVHAGDQLEAIAHAGSELLGELASEHDRSRSAFHPVEVPDEHEARPVLVFGFLFGVDASDEDAGGLAVPHQEPLAGDEGEGRLHFFHGGQVRLQGLVVVHSPRDRIADRDMGGGAEDPADQVCLEAVGEREGRGQDGDADRHACHEHEGLTPAGAKVGGGQEPE